MYTLGINTATQNSSVCLLKGKELLGEITWNERSQETKFLIPAVDKLLDNSGIHLENLEQLILISGPGPFTGLRIGVVLANALAQNLAGLNMFELNTFQFLQLRSLAKPETILINAGGEMVFKLDLKNREAASLDRKTVSQEVLIQKLSECEWDSAEMDLSPKQGEIIGLDPGIQKELISFAEVCVKLIEEKELNEYSVKELPLLPYYVKSPSIN